MTNTESPALNYARGLVAALVVVTLIIAFAMTLNAPALTIVAPPEDGYDVTFDCLVDSGYMGSPVDGAEQLVGVTSKDWLYCRFVG